MESDLKTTLLRSIGKVYERAENCQLTESAFQSMEAELETITNYFRVTKKQAFFIALIFALNYKGDSVDLKDLVDYFGCNPMTLLEHSNEIEKLYSLGILTKTKSRHRVDVSLSNDQFVINEKVTKAILDNEPMPEPKKLNFTSLIEVLEEIYMLGSRRDDGEIPVKAKIWKSKLPAFSIGDCKYLAVQFDFSGGQIDNIVRKSEMNEVINGKLVTLKEVVDFCRVEQLSNSERVKIGYTKN